MEMKRCYGCMSPLDSGPVCQRCGYDQRTSNAAHQLPAGTVLKEQYLIGKVLGQGGFGITYLGWDLYLDIPVAIKEYYPSGMVMRETTSTLSVTSYIGDDGSRFHNNRDRFMREAKMLARFAHVPEIVQVKNFFLANNTAYIVMEYIQGITLKEYVRRRGGCLEVRETFAILQPIMAALHKIHKAGLIHRDISPDNIMMLRGGGAKLLDFGAVRDVGTATDVDKELTKSTEAILKQGYAPMEQYQHRGALGPWTDVYALCATMYYCLTGVVPPDAPARMLDDAPLTFDSRIGLRPEQQNALMKGMALRAADRLHSMEQLHQELFGTAIPKGSDVPAAQPPQQPQPPEPQKPKKPNPAKKWIALAAVLVLLIAGGLGIWYLRPEKSIPKHTENTTEVTEEEPQPTEQLPDSPQETEPQLILQADPAENTMKEGSVGDYEKGHETAAFGTVAKREQVLSITVVDTLKDAPEDAVDISANGNGKVLAWVVPNGALYDLYLGADGGVYAPANSSGLFACYTNVKTIEFGDAFHTDNVQLLYATFYKCTALETLDLTGFRTEKVTNMGYLASKCFALTEIKLEGLDTAAVTSMEYMFSDCAALTKLDISGFETGEVRSMNYMFCNCANLTELALGSFDTGNVRDMAYMFKSCTAATKLDVANFDTSNVKDMRYMFADCPALTDLDVSGFRTGAVENMRCMFYGCTALTELKVDGFDTSKAKDMSWMFSQCSSVTELNVSGFETGKAEDLSCMFYGCAAVTELKTGNFDTRKAVDMSYMFSGCVALEKLDISNFETVRVGKMNSMFANCESLTELKVENFDTGNVTDMYAMFFNCKRLTELNVSGFNTENVTDMRFLFAGCSNVKVLDVSNFKTGNVESMRHMFQDCWAVEELKVDGFDTANVNDMAYMFHKCISLKELNTSRFDTAKVTDMSYMFSQCAALTKLDVKSFATGRVISMEGMFKDCTGLTYLGVAKFDTAEVTSMKAMFQNCSGLTNLEVKNFVTDSVTDMSYMFCECRGLKSLDIRNFNTANVTDMSYMFYGCDSMQNLKLGQFSTASVTNYENFMEPEKKVNGKPWEQLFA